MKHLSALLLLLVFIPCFAQTGIRSAPDHYRTKDFDVVIFPSNLLASDPKNQFTPTRKEVDMAEKALTEQLKNLNTGTMYYRPPALQNNLKKYKRQYFGVVGKNGEKILFINCLWDRVTDKWLSQKIVSLDGGGRFWNVKYNLQTGKLFDLTINKNMREEESE